jgi:chromosome segregation ATPase
LSSETTQKADQISPFRIGVLYRIEALLREVSDKEISNLGESELNELNKKIISELQEEKEALSRDRSRLSDENYVVQQRLRNYSDAIDRLNNILDERESYLSKLQEKLRCYLEINQSKQLEINTLNLELTRVDDELKELQAQKNYFNEQIKHLEQDIRRKQADIDNLTSQLKRYSGIKTLEGEYIGNLSDRNSRYHFDRKCNHWKMLVGEYVLNLDVSREIVSSKTPTFFIGKLRECDRCAGRKN